MSELSASGIAACINVTLKATNEFNKLIKPKYMTDTLNGRILAELNKQTDHIGGETVYAIDDFKFPDLANEIEKLLLQEKIDLLNSIYKECINPYNGFTFEVMGRHMQELNNQLNLIP